MVMIVIDEYLQKQASPAQRAEYERIRKIVKQLGPDAEETISYGIPTFKYKGKYILYFAAFKTHMSVYPTTATKTVAATKGTRGTYQYTKENPVPESIIKDIVTGRLKSIIKS